MPESSNVTMDDLEALWPTSVDICAFCGDSECDGIGCIAALDPNDESDHLAIERLHAWIRAGQAWERADGALAWAENRLYQWHPRSGIRPSVDAAEEPSRG